MKEQTYNDGPARAAGEHPNSRKEKENEMTYQVRFHWDKWEVVREPDHHLMRQCNSMEDADNYAAKLSSYDH